MDSGLGVAGAVASELVMGAASRSDLPPPHLAYDIVCVGPDGREKWREHVKNLVTTQGRNDIIDKYFKGSAYTAAWFLGLKGTGTPAASDTLATHPTWSEITPYTGNRPAITFGTTSGGSNTASMVSISINATATVAGALLSSVASGTSGVMYSVADFPSSRSVLSGDTLNITPTVSAT